MAANQALEKIRRNQILEAAIQMLANNGSANVTMEEVAKTADLSKGGVAYYYASKDELFKAAFQEFFGRIFDRGRNTMTQFEDPLDKILSFGWLFNDEEPIIRDTGYPLLMDLMHKAVHEPEYRQVFTDWVGGWIGLLKDALDLGVEQKRFEVEDTIKTARAISAIYQGFATRWYLDRENHETKWAREACKTAIKRYLGC